MNRSHLVIIAVLSLACSCVSADQAGQTDIATLKDFADSYEPVSTEALPCPWLPVPPPAVRSVLENHRVDDEYCRHVSLVLLKLDRSHIERFSQSYDLREGAPNPFLSAFARMARIGDEWDRDKLDYLGSDIVEYWVNLHTYEMRDERIAREMKRIRTKRKRDRGGGRRNR